MGRARKTRRWRNNRDVEEQVLAGMRRAGEESVLAATKSQDLFMVDTGNRKKPRASAKAAAAAKRKRDERHGLKKKTTGKSRDDIVVERLAKKIKANSAAGKPAPPRAPATPAGVFDLWAATATTAADAHRRGRRGRRRAPETLNRRAKMPKCAKDASTRYSVKAVEVGNIAGISYNPSFEDHQDAVGAAVAAEIAYADRKKQLEQVPKQSNVELVTDSESESEAEEEEEDEQEKVGRVVAQPKPKTKQQRAKAQRVKEEKQAAARAKAQRRFLHEAGIAKTLVKGLAADEVQREAARAQQARLLAEKFADPENAPIKRGGKVAMDAPHSTVPLTEELKGTMRGLTPVGSIARDTLNGLLRRNLVEVGDKQRKKYKQNQYKAKRAHKTYGKSNWGVEELIRRRAPPPECSRKRGRK